MASAAPERSKKLQILLIPFFATSHIGPHADFAVRLAAARPMLRRAHNRGHAGQSPGRRSALQRHGPIASSAVKIATYPFPDVDGLPPGVENLSSAAGSGDAWRVDAAAIDEALTRPAQEALVRARSPDAVVSDVHFFWNSAVAAELGVPCVTFSVIGSFSMLAMRHLGGIVGISGPGGPALELTVPGFPGRTELPEVLRCQQTHDGFKPRLAASARPSCFGLAVNTFLGPSKTAFLDLEQPYCEFYARQGYVKRAYFVGPLFLPLPQAGGNTGESPPCIRWLGSMPSSSVLYVCFGTYASISGDQLRELALGLEDSGKPFLWVLRADGWAPPPAGGVGGAGRKQGDARQRMGPASCDTIPSGRGGVPDALRVELDAGGGRGRRADADMASSVRSVHRGEVGHGCSQDRRESVERTTEHEVRGEGDCPGGGGSACRGQVLGAWRNRGGCKGQSTGARREGSGSSGRRRIIVPRSASSDR